MKKYILPLLMLLVSTPLCAKEPTPTPSTTSVQKLPKNFIPVGRGKESLYAIAYVVGAVVEVVSWWFVLEYEVGKKMIKDLANRVCIVTLILYLIKLGILLMVDKWRSSTKVVTLDGKEASWKQNLMRKLIKYFPLAVVLFLVNIPFDFIAINS